MSIQLIQKRDQPLFHQKRDQPLIRQKQDQPLFHQKRDQPLFHQKRDQQPLLVRRRRAACPKSAAHLSKATPNESYQRKGGGKWISIMTKAVDFQSGGVCRCRTATRKIPVPWCGRSKMLVTIYDNDNLHDRISLQISLLYMTSNLADNFYNIHYT